MPAIRTHPRRRSFMLASLCFLVSLLLLLTFDLSQTWRCPSCSSSSPSSESASMLVRARSGSLIRARQEDEQEAFAKRSSGRSGSAPAAAAAANSSRVAICLVGGARAFELTGRTISKHLLNSSFPVVADVFLHTPLDADTFKLPLLAASDSSRFRLVAARIFKPERIEEQEQHRQLLTASGSPNGIQGLLQYFNLVEGCWRMIESYEREHGFEYKWIVRTRVDGYWTSTMPPLESFDPEVYTVPFGSSFGGLNDRLGIGSRNTSMIALRRLSLLPLLHGRGYKGLNSEQAFLRQLQLNGTGFKQGAFPFCVLSSRIYAWPPGAWDVPVLAISNDAPMNGAKCRPCVPKAVGRDAERVVKGMVKGWGWTPGEGGVQLCDASREWGSTWRDTFDRVAGPLASRVRKEVEEVTAETCMRRLEGFRRLWQVWDAPTSRDICGQRFAELVGSPV